MNAVDPTDLEFAHGAAHELREGALDVISRHSERSGVVVSGAEGYHAELRPR